MPASLSIDDQNEVAQIYWVDDKGDTDAQAPSGAVVTYGVDDPTVATIDPQSGQLSPQAEGSANVTVSITDQDGNPLMEPDGQTPFSVEPTPFQVVAGQAVGAGLAIKSNG